MTEERLLEIDARTATTHAYFSTASACADMRELIAALRKAQAEIAELRANNERLRGLQEDTATMECEDCGGSGFEARLSPSGHVESRCETCLGSGFSEIETLRAERPKSASPSRRSPRNSAPSRPKTRPNSRNSLPPIRTNPARGLRAPTLAYLTHA